MHTVIEKLGDYTLLWKLQRDMLLFSVCFSENGSVFFSMGVCLFLKGRVCFFENGSLFFEKPGLAWWTLVWIMVPAVAETDLPRKLESTNYHAIGNSMLFWDTNVSMLSFVVDGSKGIMSLIWKVTR